MKLFTKHPHSVGETYLEHMKFASGCGFCLVMAGLACIVHSIFPFWFKTTASDKIAELHCLTKDRKPNDQP